MSARGFHTGRKTKTQQQFKDDNNPANIVNRFQATGQVPNQNSQEGRFLDISELGDFTEQLNRVTEVSQSFQNLPSGIRARFQNNPANMLDFMSDGKNQVEAENMGLVPRTEATRPELKPKEPKEPKKPSTPEEPKTPHKEPNGSGENKG